MENERSPHPLGHRNKIRNHRKTKESELPAAVLRRLCFCCWICFPDKAKRRNSFLENTPFLYFHNPISAMICCICARSPSGRLWDTAASRAFCSSLERVPPWAKASPYSRKTSNLSSPVLSLLFSWASRISRSRSSPSASICAFVQSIQSLLLYKDLPCVHDPHEGIQSCLFPLGQAGANG